MRAGGGAVVGHVVAGAHRLGSLADRLGELLDLHAGEAGEVGEAGDAATHCFTGDGRVVVDDAVDVGAEAERARVAPGGFGALAGEGDALGQPLDVRADGEADAIGDSSRHLDHLRAGGRHLDRHVRHVDAVEPLDAARGPVAVDRVTVEVGAEPLEVQLEVGGRRRLAADLGHRGVAAADADHEASAARHLDAERGGGGDRRVTTHRVRDAGPSSMRLVAVAARISWLHVSGARF